MNLSRVLATSTTETSGTRFQPRMVAADLVTFPKAGFALTDNFRSLPVNISIYAGNKISDWSAVILFAQFFLSNTVKLRECMFCARMF